MWKGLSEVLGFLGRLRFSKAHPWDIPTHPFPPSAPPQEPLRDSIPMELHPHGAPGGVGGQKSPWNAGKGLETGFLSRILRFQGWSNSCLIPGSSFVIGSAALVPMFSFLNASLPISKDISFIPPFPLSSPSPFSLFFFQSPLNWRAPQFPAIASKNILPSPGMPSNQRHEFPEG